MIYYFKKDDELWKGQKRKRGKKGQVKDINAPSYMKPFYATKSYMKRYIKEYVNIALDEIKSTTSQDCKRERF